MKHLWSFQLNIYDNMVIWKAATFQFILIFIKCNNHKAGNEPRERMLNDFSGQK